MKVIALLALGGLLHLTPFKENVYVGTEKESWSFHLVQVDDNILVFTDKEGNLLVGNDEFSYTLNRRKDEHPVIR